MHDLTLFLLIILAMYLFVQTSQDRPSASNTSNTSNTNDENIRTLVRQAARWSTAATQDANPMIAVLHANYGAGYLWALKDIASDSEIERASNINIKKFTREIVAVQDVSTKKMVGVCPDFGPARTYLTSIGGE